VLPSATDVVHSFETLGDANSVAQQRAPEDHSTHNMGLTLNITLDQITVQCTSYTLRA
jgi:hypothetical protein